MKIAIGTIIGLIVGLISGFLLFALLFQTSGRFGMTLLQVFALAGAIAGGLIGHKNSIAAKK